MAVTHPSMARQAVEPLRGVDVQLEQLGRRTEALLVERQVTIQAVVPTGELLTGELKGAQPPRSKDEEPCRPGAAAETGLTARAHDGGIPVRWHVKQEVGLASLSLSASNPGPWGLMRHDPTAA